MIAKIEKEFPSPYGVSFILIQEQPLLLLEHQKEFPSSYRIAFILIRHSSF